MCFGGFLDQEDNKELMIYSVFIVEEWSLQGHINYLFFLVVNAVKSQSLEGCYKTLPILFFSRYLKHYLEPKIY